MIYPEQKLLSEISTLCSRRLMRMVDVIDLPTPPANVGILRFDVERSLSHQLELAGRLAKLSCPATFYFHTRVGCYDAELLRRFSDFGHEVAFHHECLDRCRGDYAKARELFLREVELFRRDGMELSTVCSHGEAGLPKVGYESNLDLFVRYPDLLRQAGLRGEVYFWLRDNDVLYASDTFREYSKFWGRFSEAREALDRPFMMLAHLHRWHSNPLRTMTELGRDVVQNLGNRMLRRRRYRLAY